MALSDKFKDIIEDSAKNEQSKDSQDLVDLQKQTETNLLKIINRLTGKALSSLDEINIQDVKDIKDLTTIYKLLTEDHVDTNSSPAINTNMAKFYSVNFNLPEGSEPTPKELDKKLDEMSEEDIDKLKDGHAKALNDNNLKSFGS